MTIQEKSLAIVGGSVLATGAVLMFGFQPLLTEYRDLRIQVAARENEAATLQQQQQTLDTLNKQFQQQTELVNKLKVAVPTDEGYPELLTQLGNIANATSVVLSTVQPVQNTQINTGVGVTLTVQGNFEQIKAFILKLNSNLRPVTVRSMNLVNGGDPNNLAKLNATFQITFARVTANTAVRSTTVGGEE